MKAIESLILQGENPQKSMKSEFSEKDKMEEEKVRNKLTIENEQDFKKTRLDNFLKKESKALDSKKYLPLINRKLIMEKNTIEKEKDPKGVLPSLIIEKTKMI